MLLRSAAGHGLYTQGIIGFALLTLDDISTKGTDFGKSIKENILQKWDTYPPNLQYQYKIQLDRLDRGLEFEVATYPGLNALAGRGTYHAMTAVLRFIFISPSTGLCTVQKEACQFIEYSDASVLPRYYCEPQSSLGLIRN